jgi:hypothetical protein
MPRPAGLRQSSSAEHAKEQFLGQVMMIVLSALKAARVFRCLLVASRVLSQVHW